MIQPSLPRLFASRECRPCTVCCVHLSVGAIALHSGSKPAGVPCPHLEATGCRHYAIRVGACRNFRCAWLADETWPDEWRPDQIGLICLREHLDGVGEAGLVYETEPGALDRPEAARLLDELHRTTVLYTTVDFHQQSRHSVWGALHREPLAA